jgi:hypothetical protein
MHPSMDVAFSTEEIVQAKAEWAKARDLYDDETLIRLCESGARAIFRDPYASAEGIVAQIESAAQKGAALSLIRVGDGEGHVLDLQASSSSDARALKCFNTIFFRQTGVKLGFDEAQFLCRRVTSSILDGDILGFRSVDRGFEPNELSIIAGAIDGDANGIRAAIGMMAARQFLEIQVANGSFRHSILTSAWIHLTLVQHIERLCAAFPAVIVISGRSELAGEFDRRIGGRLREFITVPRGYWRGETREPQDILESHYFKDFPKVMQKLRGDLRGALVLVGAGFLGKLYCHAAKKSGAVAVDLGSAFDVLANQLTRPEHRHLDMTATRWL